MIRRKIAECIRREAALVEVLYISHCGELEEPGDLYDGVVWDYANPPVV